MKKPLPSLTLREARKKKGLTQVELAEKTGLAQSHISKLELGKVAEPLFSRGLRIADACDVDPHRLKFGAETVA